MFYQCGRLFGRKSQFFERKVKELQAKLLEEQKEVQRLKAQQGAAAQQAQAAVSAFDNDEAFEAAPGRDASPALLSSHPTRSRNSPSPSPVVSSLEPPSLFDADSPTFEAALSQVSFR